jgi:outer membrane lipoprotein-sorting protein
MAFCGYKESRIVDKKIIIRTVFILLLMVSTCWAGGCGKNLAASQPEKETCPVEMILKQLDEEALKLKSYQCRIEYLFSQPVLESETLRKGSLYYARAGEKSKLRINFQTLKQDDEKEQKYVEQYIFDGVWLTHIDYQIKQVKLYQQAEPNEPVDAFELASQNFPIIGFSKVEDLKKEFELKLVEQGGSKSKDFIQLHLKVKPDSIYKDDYTSIDFWIDKKLNLPARIVAVSTEEDIYQIKFLKAKVNKKLNKNVFEVKIPKGFGKPEIIPLNVKEK